MQKPSSIDLTTGLMALFIALGLVSTFNMALPPMPANVAANPMVTPQLIASMTHGMAIFGALIAAICVFFYWKGHEWARWLVMIDCVLVLLGLFGLHKNFATSHFSGFLSLAKIILAIYLLWNLNTAPVKAWFKMPKSGEPVA
jgi:hypothetical protein